MAGDNSPRHTRKPKKARAPVPSARAKAAAKKKAGASGAELDADPAAAIPGFDRSVRLQKLLASAGFGSRRDVEQYVTEERVTVNGRTATLGDKADPTVDDIRFDGERIAKQRPAYWIVNKPRGVVTTMRDDGGRRTVVSLVPTNAGRLFPVGRLDKETSGLLLMTNDGDVAHALLHPSHGNEREYRVNVKGLLDTKGIKSLERGVTLEEGRTASVRVEDVRHDPESGTSSLSLTLVEGKKRQIRRTLLVLGFPVRRLVRVRMGPLRLGRLAVGEARTLRSDERQALLEHVRRLRAGETPLAAATKSVPAGKRDVAAPPRPNAARRGRGPSDSSSRPGASKSSKPPIRGRKAGASRDGMGRSAPKKSARKKTARKKSSGRPSSSSSASSRSSSPSASRAPSRVTSPSASRAPSRVTSPSASRSSSRASSPSASRAPSRAPKKPVSRRPSSSGSSSPPRGPKRSTGTNAPSGPKGPRGSGPGGAGRQRTASSRKGVRR